MSLFISCLLSLSAQDIVKGVENLQRGTTSQGTYYMEVIRPDYRTSYTMRFWDDRAHDRSLVVIVESSTGKDDGSVFLKKNNNLWMFLPKAGKNMRMPPSMMLDPWMGSDLTNDDLVKESSISKDYNATIVSQKGDEYLLELQPKPDAPVVWGKVLLSVKMPGYIPVKAEYYDEDGVLVRSLVYSDVKLMGGRRMPTKMEVIPKDKPGHKTVLRVKSVEFDVRISDDHFDVNQMQRWSDL